MTEKLYFADNYISEFEARVLDVIRKDNYSVIILNQTAFFPEGGGQLSDTGYIGDCFIYNTLIENDIIYHYTKSNCNLSVNSSVNCRIDKEKRFLRMQAHSGEHIISGIAHSLFGANNVGFHMDDTLMTVDFDIPLTTRQLDMIEEKANECVYKNLKITASLVSVENAKKLEYRSKLEFNDDVRIVEIESVDLCACCAPHVNRTGEIGLIKILTSASHRGGVRITLICGKTAYSDYIMKHNSTLNIASSLCAKHNETDIAVKRLLEANSELKYKAFAKQLKLLEIIADTIKSEDVIVSFIKLPDASDLRELTNLLKGKCKTSVMLFSGDDNSGYSYCFYSEILNLSKLVKDFNAALHGNGGGRGVLIQGKTSAGRQQISEFINNLRYNDYENETKKES